MTAIRDDALVGRHLDGRYLVGERIARGGMASVFHGHDERLDRPVAIKVMHSGLGDDEEFSQRFEREARAAAKLNHRGVVAVFDQGRDGDVTYLVMEYVPGRTLRDVMRDEAPMGPARALSLLAKVLTALSAAHTARLVHRDVKPENVLITPEGEVKVADFGLARAVSAATTATGGTLIGTVSYLAPEIVVNEGADARSDVYACGAVLYEMLTGVKPHTGDSPIQVAYKHVHEDIAAPSERVPALPPYVDALVARATVRDRSQRPQDAGVLLRQVRLVQRALSEGLADDPDLVADLTPRTIVVDDEPTVAVESPAAGTDDATVLVTHERPRSRPEPPPAPEGDEPTMRWSSQEWSAGAPAQVAAVPRGPRYDPPVDRESADAARRHDATSRRGRVLLVAAVVLAVALAGFGYWLGVGRFTDAPSLVGASETQAQQQAEAQGFVFEVTRRAFSETAAAGTVIATDPAPGARVLPESTIRAIVSAGPERYKVPDLNGLTIEQARAALADLNLELGDQTEAFSEHTAEGRVMKTTDREVGSEVKRGTPIDVVVSKGRQPFDVPDQTGKPSAEAKAAIEAAKGGFQPVIRTEFSDDVEAGTVIRQDPAGGQAFRGAQITIVVSRGPEEVDVPDVEGRDEDEAVEILEEAGFEVEVRNVIPGSDEVRFQSPGSGKARVGSTVTIYV